MRLLLALLLQKLQYIAGFRNFREVELRFDFGRRLLPGGAGLRGKMLSDPVRFIVFY